MLLWREIWRDFMEWSWAFSTFEIWIFLRAKRLKTGQCTFRHSSIICMVHDIWPLPWGMFFGCADLQKGKILNSGVVMGGGRYSLNLHCHPEYASHMTTGFCFLTFLMLCSWRLWCQLYCDAVARIHYIVAPGIEARRSVVAKQLYPTTAGRRNYSVSWSPWAPEGTAVHSPSNAAETRTRLHYICGWTGKSTGCVTSAYMIQ